MGAVPPALGPARRAGQGGDRTPPPGADDPPGHGQLRRRDRQLASKGARTLHRDGREPAGRKMVFKPIPWKTITEGPTSDPIITTDPNGKRHRHNAGLISSEWDAWQVPLLWQHFTAP